MFSNVEELNNSKPHLKNKLVKVAWKPCTLFEYDEIQSLWNTFWLHFYLYVTLYILGFKVHTRVLVPVFISHGLRAVPALHAWVQSAIRLHNHRQLHQFIECIFICIQQSGRSVNPMNSKNKKNSAIHENADANITCDFGDGDISRFRSRLWHTRPHR